MVKNALIFRLLKLQMEEIAFYLGHKSTNTTKQIYVRKDNDVSKKLGKKLQERMG